MSTALPPHPEPPPQGLSEPERIINTFVAPSKTFADIRRNAGWWVPWLTTGVFFCAVFLLFNKRVDLDQLVRDQIANTPFQSQAFEGLSKEKQDQAVARGIKFQKATPYFLPIITLVVGLVIAAILMGTFNFIHESSVSYMQSLAIFFYAGLPSIVTSLLAIITLAMAPDMEGRNPKNLVATNPAYFMDYHHGSKFLYGMAASLDIVSIWVIVLLGIGFKVNSAKSKLSTGTAIGTVFALYLVWKVIVSSIGFV